MARGTFVAIGVCRNIGYYILVTRPELPDVPLTSIPSLMGRCLYQVAIIDRITDRGKAINP